MIFFLDDIEAIFMYIVYGLWTLSRTASGGFLSHIILQSLINYSMYMHMILFGRGVGCGIWGLIKTIFIYNLLVTVYSFVLCCVWVWVCVCLGGVYFIIIT